MTNLYAGDGRICFFKPVPVEQVQSTLEQCDMLVAPSQRMETGPLVVLEGSRAGIPVPGGTLGGIAELVQHGVDGLLVQPCDEAGAWKPMLEALGADPGMMSRLARGGRPPRGMDVVVEKIKCVYENMVAASAG
jgi:glycosyltransferase involved in cell wall biosynthesis